MLKGLFQRLTGKAPKLAEKLSYEEARTHLEGQDTQVRTEMAGRAQVRPEILYYLAEDKSPDVRRHIAANPNTPVQADHILAEDKDDEVRVVLAQKISRLVPETEKEEQEELHERRLAVLEILIRDQLPRVRAVVAEEIKHSRNVPSHIVNQLARDVELIVAEPILEYSPVLTEDDLRDIVATTETQGAVAAVARRAEVPTSVADAVVETMDVEAITSLLGNKNAQIREETLDTIIEEAERVKSWHEPIVHRPELTVQAMRRVSDFVASSMLKILAQRNELDEATAARISEKVQVRLQEERQEVKEADSARKAVEQMQQEGKLGDEEVQELLEQGKRGLAIQALALLAGVGDDVVERIVERRDGKPITALTWRAGLTMRTALRMQTQLARVPSKSLVNARGGVDYPMKDEEMNWHLEHFDVSPLAGSPQKPPPPPEAEPETEPETEPEAESGPEEAEQPDKIQRRLTTILAADVAGYSRLMEIDEESTYRTLEAHRKIIDSRIDAHDGTIFNTAGDAVIAEFASAVEAVRCAYSIQMELEERDQDVAQNSRMRWRIGINLGDVIVEGENLLGDGVNVASRIEGLAEPGTTCVSREVHAHVVGKVDFGFDSLGPQKVKNMSRPIEIYRVNPEAAPESLAGSGAETGSLMGRLIGRLRGK